MNIALAVLCVAFALAAANPLDDALISDLQVLTNELQVLSERLTVATASSQPSLDLRELSHDYDPKSKHSMLGKHSRDGKYHHTRDATKQSTDHGSADKAVIKMFEKYRSKIHAQPNNPDTFQFSSELTCQDPSSKARKANEGDIVFPLVTERMKLTTVGVCEWTVTQVQPSKVSEHATLKGNTNVVCKFTEEVNHHCAQAEDVLSHGTSISAQGLAYNFALYSFHEPELEREHKSAHVEAESKQVDTMDVYLSVINGVASGKTQAKYDSGAVQYFFGKPPTANDVGRDAAYAKEGDHTGQYTFVFKF